MGIKSGSITRKVENTFEHYSDIRRNLVGNEDSVFALDFTSQPPKAMIRGSTTLSPLNYYGTPFYNDGGPMNFSRASLATVTDSDGKVKWAPHNLLLASEQFDASQWLKGANITVSANSAAAPNGTTTADKVSSSGNGDSSLNRISQVSTSSAGAVVFNIWMRAATPQAVRLKLYDNSGASVLTTLDAAVTSTWTMFTVTGTVTTGNASVSIGADGTTALTNIEMWGAHLYRSDLGGMQANTSAYPMYNPTTPKNLLGYTESFNNTSGWTVTDATVTADATIAPNGLTTGDAVYEAATTAVHGVLTSSIATTVSGTKYVASVYAKANGRNYCILLDSQTGVGKFFDLVNGTVLGDYNASPPAASSITSIGNGWYRCSITVTATTALRFRIYTSTDGTTASFAGDTSKGIYLWGAQLSDSASLDAYSPVYGAAVTSAAYYGPRRDFDPVTLACKGLLVEEQRSNLALNSAALNDASWSLTNATISANVAGSTAVAPDGTNTADKLVEDNNTGIHRVFPLNAITVVSGSTYTYSIYAKAVERTRIQLVDNDIQGAIFDLSNGTVSSPGTGVTAPPPVAVGNGWYRCSITRNAGSTAGRIAVYLVDGTGSTNYAGVTGNGVLLYGAQLEAGSFATSYIPTGAATATRNGDVASVSTQAFPYSATEGTLVANVTLTARPATQTFCLYALSDGTTSERILVATGAGSGGNINSLVTDGGVLQAQTVNGSLATAGTYKYGNIFKVDDFASVVNGGAAVTDTSGTVPTMTVLHIGSSGLGSSQINGHIRQITYIPRRLTNAELQQRTA